MTRSQRELQDISGKINAWAQANGLGESSVINDLVSDLLGRTNWSYWSDLDADQILPPLPLIKTRKLNNWYRRLIFSRNLLVFLPVTITWIAIAEASSAFSQYIAENPGNLVNFLQFWQDGYGYLSSIWRLSNIAFIDFLILTFIMVLTIFLHLIGNKSEKSELVAMQSFSKDRNNLCKEIYVFFQKNQKVTPLSMNRVLATALRDLSKSAENLERMTRELSKSTRGLPNQIETLKQLRQVQSTVRKISKERNGSNPPQ
jgi:hypothetical protein